MISRAVRAATIAIVAMGALVVAPTASAAPADLTSATQENRVLSASWTLPEGATAWVLEASTDPSFDFDTLGLFADLGATESGFTAIESLPGGTYYVRIITTPTPDACVVADPSCVFEFSNVLTVVVPSQAATLQALTQFDGVVSGTWALPAGAASWYAEISTNPARDQLGFFDVALASDLGPAQTSLTAHLPLPPGVYYAQIRTTPTYDLCLDDLPGCVFELSNILSVTIPAPGGAKPAPLPPPPALDRVLALGVVIASSSQDVDRLSITLNAGEGVKVTLSGTVSVAGASKVYRFRTVRRNLGAGKTKLALRLPAKGKRVVKRALKRRKRLRAKLRLVVTDAAGNTQRSRYTVRLKP